MCYQTGRCLYTIALHKSPDHEMQWDKKLMSMITSLKSDSRDENHLNPLDHYSALSRVMRKDSATRAEVILFIMSFFKHVHADDRRVKQWLSSIHH